MQTKNLNGVHCSLGTVESEREQCNTCHGIEQEIAQASHTAYHGPYNKKLLPPSVDQNPLDAIAKICRSLTFGEMTDLGKQLGIEPSRIHGWSKNYGMDNTNVDGSIDITTGISNNSNDLNEP